MSLVESARHFLVRFRYPVSLPEEVGEALGCELSNKLRFYDLLKKLLDPHTRFSKIYRGMTKEKSEKAFRGALRKELFGSYSLYSFYFTQGWLEFELQFDEHELLRRVYLHHKLISYPHGYEIALETKLQNAV